MLSTDQRRSRLEELLERVRKNKGRPGTTDAAAAPSTPSPTAAVAPEPSPLSAAVQAQPKPEPAPLVAPLIEPPTPPEPFAAEPEDDDIDFGFVESAPPAAPAPVESLPAMPAEEVATPRAQAPAPTPAPATPAAAIPPQTFQSTPDASGPVVAVVGDRPVDWTIGAVLQRAWQFGVN